MYNKKYLKQYADERADNIIAYFRCFPCHGCGAEDSVTNKCNYGYIRRGACPVYKKVRERLKNI